MGKGKISTKVYFAGNFAKKLTSNSNVPLARVSVPAGFTFDFRGFKVRMTGFRFGSSCVRTNVNL